MPESQSVFLRERISDALFLDSDEEMFAGRVWKWVQSFVSKYHSHPTAAVVRDEFQEWDFQPPTQPVAYVVDQLRRRYRRNYVQRVVETLARQVNVDPDAAAARGLQEFHELHRTTLSRRDRLDSGDWGLAIDDYERRVEDGKLNGITFGFAEMDSTLGGLRKGGLYYVIGRPKRYKSWLLLKSAAEAQREQRKRVAFFSLELTHQEMYDRYLCMMSGVPWNRFQRGELSAFDLQRMREEMEASEELGHIEIMHPATEDCTVMGLLRQAEEIEADVMYIDQLKYVKATQKVSADLRFREVEYINEDLKRASEQMPIYVAAQFNREAAGMSEMADLAKIGLSDSIGQTADMLFGIHANKEMLANRTIEFGTIESRSFEHARWLLSVELSTNSNFRMVERID